MSPTPAGDDASAAAQIDQSVRPLLDRPLNELHAPLREALNIVGELDLLQRLILG